jgi:hypothetical protein
MQVRESFVESEGHQLAFLAINEHLQHIHESEVYGSAVFKTAAQQTRERKNG